MRELIRHQFWIVAVASVVIFTNLGVPGLWDEDEPKNAACGAEMFARGDWIKPTFNDDLRTDKPILLYWCMLISYSLFGVGEFAARLPSALCGIGTALLTYHLGRRMFSAQVGLWAGLLLASSLMFVVASRAATPDGLLIFCSTLALWCFVRGTFPAKHESNDLDSEKLVGFPTDWKTYLSMYAAMGLAVLAKGPIGILLPGTVIGCYLLCVNGVKWSSDEGSTGLGGVLKNRATWLVKTFWPTRVFSFAWKLRPFTALAIVTAIALPWYLAVGLQTNWEWTKGFFMDHNVGRFNGALEGHSGPPFYHVLSIAIGFFPASIFLVPMFLNVVKRLSTGSPQQQGFILAVSWVAVYVIFFSISGTKLPSYVTPTYPALALLAACWVHQWVSSLDRVELIWNRVAISVFGIVGVGILVGVSLIAKEFIPDEEALALIGLIPLVGAAVVFGLNYCERAQMAAVSFVIFAAAFSTAMFGWGVLRVDRFQNAQLLVETIEEHSQGQPKVTSFEYFRPSWVFYAKQPVERIDAQKAKTLFKDRGDAFLITDATRLKKIQKMLPSDVEVLFRRKRFLREGEVVLLGRRGSTQPYREAAAAQTTAQGEAPIQR